MVVRRILVADGAAPNGPMESLLARMENIELILAEDETKAMAALDASLHMIVVQHDLSGFPGNEVLRAAVDHAPLAKRVILKDGGRDQDTSRAHTVCSPQDLASLFPQEDE